MRVHPNEFVVTCCGWRRSVLPGGVIVCTSCDYAKKDGHTSWIPNEVHFMDDIPAEVDVWRVYPLAPS